LVHDYVEITSDPVRGPRNNKRNLIATCYRVHGDDFVPFVRDIFRVEGSAQNLLGVMRRAEPRLSDGYPDEPTPWMATLLWRWNFAMAPS
jgi:hypothetical protein